MVAEGLKPGDRLALHWHNSFEAAALYFGTFKSGVIAVPINLRLKPAEIAYLFEHSGATVCLSSPPVAAAAEAAAASCPTMRRVIRALPDESHERELPSVDAARTAVILYTSGTTARPKGVEWSHEGMLGLCRSVESELWSGDDVGLCTTPMMHISALAFMIAGIQSGTATVLLPGFDPAAILDQAERHRCTYTFTLPALLQFILDEQARRPREIAALRTWLVGGDSVPGALYERARQVLGVSPQEVYASTEAGFISLNPVDAIREGSMGTPISSVQVRIVDPADNDVAEGETGELLLRNAAACSGYWRDAQATADLMRGGWLHTGDLASRDAEDYLWFRGRAKQIIVRAGSNISPQEVEETLYRHPAVREAGVTGRPDPVYGETVVAFIALKSGAEASESELREFARKRLADYKTPERIVFLSDLPKGLTGKVDRRALKETLMTEARGEAV
jgi:long-chain acyl-CoA synthetase